MKHIRIRRRFKLVLVFLLAFSLILFFEARVESFAPQLKVFTEYKIEEIFDNNIKLSIGRLDGGILHPLAVNGCRIMAQDGAILFPSLEIDSIRSNYRLWDVFFKRNSPSIDIKFALNDRDIIGFVRIEGSIENARIKGYIDIFGTDKVDVIAKVRNRSFEAEFKSKYGLIKAKGTLSQDNELAADIAVSHLQVKGFDITCDAALKNNLTLEPSGEIEISNLIVNYRPFSDIKGSYKIVDKTLDIKNLEIGNGLKAYGRAHLDYPHKIDITITADNVNLTKILTDLNVDRDDVPLSGTMNARFELKGPVGNPNLDARMEVRQGQIGGLDFEFLSARLKGEGPLIRIEDSRIARSSGYFMLAGDINLNRTGKGNIFENVRMASNDTAILWDELRMKKIKDIQEVKMEKRMSDDVNLGFKKYLSDSKVDESMRNTDELEVKYKLHSHESLKIKIGQDNNFFGWEHEDKF